MQAIKCEMCGSNDLIKQDGLYVCQNCGTKYTVEEAKKLLGKVTIEGTVNVKVDVTGKLDNLYTVARSARDDGNAETAEKYYDMILLEDPHSWEANFYTVYFRAMQCKIAGIQSASMTLLPAIRKGIARIHESDLGDEEKIIAVSRLAMDSIKIGDMLFDGAKSYFDHIDFTMREKYVDDFVNMAGAACLVYLSVGDNIEIHYSDNEALMVIACLAWKQYIDQSNIINGECTSSNLINKSISQLKELVKKIKKYEPDYKPPLANVGKDGCYIATCVYGSYDCPEVWTLRRFRDDILATNILGRAFIHTYYAVSPIVVKYFGEYRWFRAIGEKQLNALVKTLREKGVSDKPYQDKQW